MASFTMARAHNGQWRYGQGSLWPVEMKVVEGTGASKKPSYGLVIRVHPEKWQSIEVQKMAFCMEI